MVGPAYDYVITATAVDKVTLSGSNHMDLDVIVQWLDEEIETLQRVRALLTGHELGGSRCSAEFFYGQAAFIQIGHDREVFLHFSLFD
jgi:hypothetical protein